MMRFRDAHVPQAIIPRRCALVGGSEQGITEAKQFYDLAPYIPPLTGLAHPKRPHTTICNKTGC